MLRLLHSADWHIDVKRRFVPHIAALRWMIEQGIAQQVDAFVFSGDFFGLDAPHHARTREILALFDLLLLATSHAIVIIIPGNHDESEQFEIFEKAGLKNLFVLRNPSTCKFVAQGVSVGVVALPWLGRADIHRIAGVPMEGIDNHGTSTLLTKITRDLAKEVLDCDRALCVAHYPAPGALMGEVEVRTSHDVVLDTPTIEGCFDFVALGHLHRRQSVRSRLPKRRTWYAGSPVPIDFSESARRGCNIITIDDDGARVRFLRIPSWTMETIEFTYTGKDLVPVGAPLREHYTGCYVRCQITIPSEVRLLKKTKVFSDLEKTLKARGASDVKVNRIPQANQRKPAAQFLAAPTLDERVMRAMDERHYDASTRDRLLAAFRTLRESRSQRDGESGRTE